MDRDRTTTGEEVFVYGVSLGQPIAALYRPSTNSWRLASTNGLPSMRIHHSLVWTGEEAIVLIKKKGS